MLDRLPRHSNVIFQLISLSFLLFVMLLFEFFFFFLYTLFLLVQCHKVDLLSLTDILSAVDVQSMLGGKLFFHPHPAPKLENHRRK